MFLGRGTGGPKQSAWAKQGAQRFESFFSRNPDVRAEQPPAPAEADSAEELRWLFTGVVGEDYQPIRARVGCRVINVVSGVTGALVSKGVGNVRGEGTCEVYWALDGLEVEADTSGAAWLLCGGAGDLRLRLFDGTGVWCSEHHVSLINETDALAADGDGVDVMASEAAKGSDASGLDANTPMASDADNCSDVSHSSQDSPVGASARAAKRMRAEQQEIEERRAERLAAAAWAAAARCVERCGSWAISPRR
jgi:hypothetical protein